jgi:hypothetical protein
MPLKDQSFSSLDERDSNGSQIIKFHTQSWQVSFLLFAIELERFSSQIRIMLWPPFVIEPSRAREVHTKFWK